MKTILGIAVVVLLSLVLGANTSAQEFPAGGAPANPAASGNDTIAAQLNQQLSFVEKEFVDAAQAMPEEKYSFVPMNEFPGSDFKGVRNFAAEVMHVATANYQLYGPIVPDDPAPAAARQAASAAKTKDQIVQYLRDSFAFAHKAVSTIDAQNMLMPVRRAPNQFAGTPLELAVFGCSHVSDIYGQLVEYLRMNGIVPPATANQPARGGRGAAPATPRQ